MHRHPMQRTLDRIRFVPLACVTLWCFISAAGADGSSWMLHVAIGAVLVVLSSSFIDFSAGRGRWYDAIYFIPRDLTTAQKEEIGAKTFKWLCLMLLVVVIFCGLAMALRFDEMTAMPFPPLAAACFLLYRRVTIWAVAGR